MWAIAAALDAGITHFDVARSYGYGEAESLLGEALAGRRERVVIATKFGKTASTAARALKYLKPLAQGAVSTLPVLRPLVRSLLRSRAGNVRRFSPAAARASLNESLRALKSDYIDVLFLHECGPDELDDEMLDFLAAERDAGRICAYGVACNVAHVAEFAAAHGSRIIYQFANAITNRNVDLCVANARPRITHSPFAGADVVNRLLADHPEVGSSGRPLRAGDMHHLMLTYALGANADGVVVCSMLGEKHLKENVAVVECPRSSDEEVLDLAARITASPRVHAIHSEWPGQQSKLGV